MLEAVIKEIEVGCTQKQAFEVFVQEVTNWWPLDKNSVSAMQGEVAKQVIIEPKTGGRVYEIAFDDSENEWGSVKVYSPDEQLTLAWHIGLPAEQASEVNVSFTEVGGSKTKVVLTHSNWEVFGDKANDMREGYNQGWVGVFETAYAAACVQS